MRGQFGGYFRFLLSFRSCDSQAYVRHSPLRKVKERVAMYVFFSSVLLVIDMPDIAAKNFKRKHALVMPPKTCSSHFHHHMELIKTDLH